MTVNASARLLRNLLPLCEHLIVEHVRMTAFFSEVFRERVPRPHYFQTRIFFESRLGHDRTRISLRRRARFRFTSAVACSNLIGRLFVVVVLERKVFAPNTGIDCVVGQFDNSVEWIARFLLSLEYVHQESQSKNGRSHS